VSLAVKLKGLFAISGLRGLSFTAKSPSSVSLSSLRETSPPARAFSEFARLPPLDSFCMATSLSGGLWATARVWGRFIPPWKRENEETATSPISGDRGLLSDREDRCSMPDQHYKAYRFIREDSPDTDPLSCVSLVPSFNPLSFSEIRLPPGVFGLALVGDAV
jgi:hypothetical protein